MNLACAGLKKSRVWRKIFGVTPSQLQELVRKGPDSANLLKRMLVALHVDPKVIADIDPLVMRELQWLCITCNNKKRCERELANGTATEHFREFCPNAVSLDELLDQKGQPVLTLRSVTHVLVRRIVCRPLGHKRTFCDAGAMSALPPKADIRGNV